MSRNLFLKSRYAVILILLCLIALMEASRPFPFFRLATFIFSFVALAGVASLFRGKVRDGLVVLASLAFGLSMIEATALILGTKVSLVVVTKGWSVRLPVIGWGPEHPGRFHDEKTDPKSGVSIYKADYTIDSNLLRETRSVETGPAIVFFGDSFACKPPWLWGPRYALENGQVALKGACYEGLSLWVLEWLQNMASYRLFIESYLQKPTHEDIELYVRILLAAVNLAKEKYGVTTLIPYIRADHFYTRGPLFNGTGFSDDEVIQRLRGGGAMVVDVSLAKEEAAGAKLRIEGDGHPTPLANRLRASIIKDYIENRMPGILVAGQH